MERRQALSKHGEGKTDIRRRSRPIIGHDEELADFIKRKTLERQREKLQQQKLKEEAERKRREGLKNLEQFHRGQLKLIRPKPPTIIRASAKTAPVPLANKTNQKAQENIQPKQTEICRPIEHKSKPKPVTNSRTAIVSRPGSQRAYLTQHSTPEGPRPLAKSVTAASTKTAAPTNATAAARPRALSTINNVASATQRVKKPPVNRVLVPKPRTTIIAKVAVPISTRPQTTGRGSMPAQNRSSTVTVKPLSRVIGPTVKSVGYKDRKPIHGEKPRTLSQREPLRKATDQVRPKKTTKTQILPTKGKPATRLLPSFENNPKEPVVPPQQEPIEVTKQDEIEECGGQEEEDIIIVNEGIMMAEDVDVQHREVQDIQDIGEEEEETRDDDEAKLLWAVTFVQRRFRNRNQRRLQTTPPGWDVFVRGIVRLQALYRGRRARRKAVEDSMRQIMETIIDQAFVIYRHRQKAATKTILPPNPLEARSPSRKEGFLDARIGYIKVVVNALCNDFVCKYGPYADNYYDDPPFPLDESCWTRFAEREANRRMMATQQQPDESTENFVLHRNVKLTDRLLFDLVNQALAELATSGYQHLVETKAGSLRQNVMAKLQGWIGGYDCKQNLRKLLEQEATKLTRLEEYS